MKRKLLKVLIGVIVLLVAVLVVGWLYLDRLVAAGLEKGSEYALQVKTSVEDVDLALLAGKLDIGKMTFGNPEGYATPHLLATDKFHLELRPGSLMEDAVEINDVRFQGLDLYIERAGGQTNMSRVIQNAQRLGAKDGKAEPSEEEGKKVRIKHVLIENITAHILLVGSEEKSALTVHVKDLEFHDIGTDQPQGETIAQVISRILPAVVVAVLEEAGDALPAEYVKELTGNIAQLTASLGEGASKLIGQVGGTTGKAVLEESGKRMQEAGKTIQKGVEDIGEKLKGIIPGKKEEPPDAPE